MENKTTDAGTRKASLIAKFSLVLSVITIPFVATCCIILRNVTYNPPLTQVARIALYASYTLIPTSFLLGIGGLIHITIKRKTLYGYRTAFAGIALSLILVVTLFYNMIIAMGEHMW